MQLTKRQAMTRAIRHSSGLLRSLFLTVCVIGLSACGRDATPAAAAAPKPPQPVEVVKIVRTDLTQSLGLVGSVEANESAQIHAEMAGIVKAIRFTEGQRVKQGEVLLEIDDSELGAQMSQAEAAYELARLTLERVTRLRKSHGVSEAEYDQAVAAADSAKAELSLLRTRIAKMRIAAPFDGVVDERTVSPGDYVSTQTQITTVNDLSRLKATFEVPERYLGKVKIGTQLDLSVDGLAEDVPMMGRVYFVSSTINADTRSSVVKAMLDEVPPGLRPGMFANINLVLDVHPQTLVVPEAAVVNTVEGPRIVLARADGEAYAADLVPVRLGLRSAGWVEVFAEVPLEGQLVVSAGVGALALYPGTPVAPRPAASRALPSD